MSGAFFPGSHVLLQIVVRTGVIYLLVLIGVRLSGKREVGQMTPFDLTLLLLLSNSAGDWRRDLPCRPPPPPQTSVPRWCARRDRSARRPSHSAPPAPLAPGRGRYSHRNASTSRRSAGSAGG